MKKKRMKKIIRVGSRDSHLAIIQAELMMAKIKKAHPELTLELVTMKTTGDKILDRRLEDIGGKGLFVKELDKALLDGRIDISVHSLKDLPMETSKELPLVAFSKREDPRDAVIIKAEHSEIKLDGIMGTSSRRRIIQLKQQYQEMKFQTIRGNVQTRLRKLEEESFDQIVLAAAGLKRLGMQEKIFYIFSPEEMIPAAGQGILAVQTRAGNKVSFFLDCIKDQKSEIAAMAERSFVKALQGGCSSPIAAYAQIAGTQIKLVGLYAKENEETYRKDSIVGSIECAEKIGQKLAEKIKF